METVYVRGVAVLAGIYAAGGSRWAKLPGCPFGRGGPRVFEVIETRGLGVVNLRRPRTINGNYIR